MIAQSQIHWVKRLRRWRCITLSKARIEATGLAREIDQLLARFPNVAQNRDEERQLRAALYRPLLALGNDERVRLVDLIIATVIGDFHEIDKGSFAFRYATDNKGSTVALPSGIVSLAALREVMEGCSNFFDGSDGIVAYQVGRR